MNKWIDDTLMPMHLSFDKAVQKFFVEKFSKDA